MTLKVQKLNTYKFNLLYLLQRYGGCIITIRGRGHLIAPLFMGHVCVSNSSELSMFK